MEYDDDEYWPPDGWLPRFHEVEKDNRCVVTGSHTFPEQPTMLSRMTGVAVCNFCDDTRPV